MRGSSLILVTITAFLNIALNVFARKTARQPGAATVLDVLGTSSFALTFAVGMCSLAGLLAVHRLPDLNYSQAIALMGAVSIVGGSVLGAAFGSKLSGVEWLLVTAILLLLIYRWFAAS